MTHGHSGRTQLVCAAQFREIEALLGAPLWSSFLAYLGTAGYGVADDGGDLDDVLVAVYEADGGPAQVAERLVDLDEGLQEWRYRHVKMVARTIGDRSGTGGSSGAAYLRSTLFTPSFPALWSVRRRL